MGKYFRSDLLRRIGAQAGRQRQPGNRLLAFLQRLRQALRQLFPLLADSRSRLKGRLRPGLAALRLSSHFVDTTRYGAANAMRRATTVRMTAHAAAVHGANGASRALIPGQ